MRRTLLLTVIALLSFSVTAAEGNTRAVPVAAEGARKNTAGKDGPLALVIQHAEDLGLNGDQIRQLQSLRDDLQSEREKMMQDPAVRELYQQALDAKKSGDTAKLEELKKQLMERARSHMDNLKERIEAILTPDQLMKLRDYVNTKRPEGSEGPREKGQKPDSNKPAPKVFKGDGEASKKSE
jgi:Spy/CpxP family protein refolding chaperone